MNIHKIRGDKESYDVSNMTNQEIYKLLWPSKSRHDFTICKLHYKGIEIDSSFIEENLYLTNTKLSDLQKLEAFKDAKEAGLSVTEFNFREVCRIYQKADGDKEIFHAGISNLKQYGYMQYVEDMHPCSLEMQEATKQAFKTCGKNNGRVPAIWQSVAWICENFHLDVNQVAKNFTVPTIQKLLKAGLSGAEAVLVCNKMKPELVDKIANASPGVLLGIVTTFGEKLDCEPKWQIYTEWLANHIHTDINMVEEIFDYINNHENIKFTSSTSVMQMQQIMDEQKMIDEVKKIEFAFDLKLENCVCELKPCTITSGRYKAEILQGNDPKQVMLGYDTHCCQHLHGFGESAMIHGLVHPKAGFFVITSQFTGKVYAQGEIWEENENTLVFDNLEFANDLEIENYREVIGEWLKASPYPNCKMGLGYNTMDNELLQKTEGVYPSITAEEYCILTHTELTPENIRWAESQLVNPNKDTFLSELVYCDAKINTCIMKKDGEVSLYFRPNEQAKESTLQIDSIEIEK